LFNFFKKCKEPDIIPQFVIGNCVKNCGKEKCPLWVVNYSDGPEGKKIADGRCAIHWIPVLMIEIRQAIDRLNPNFKEAENGKQ
jgi:hypothetical protein